MELLDQIQDSISKLTNEERVYAMLVDPYLWNELLLIKTDEINFNDVFPKFNSVIIEKEPSISGFKSLTEKEYEEYKNKRCKI